MFPNSSASHVPASLQFFLREDDIGKSRADASIARLAELNAYVFVRTLEGNPGQPITVDVVKGFQVMYYSPCLVSDYISPRRLLSWSTHRYRSSWRSTTGHTKMASTSLLRGLMDSLGMWHPMFVSRHYLMYCEVTLSMISALDSRVSTQLGNSRYPE
jgi:hypothetical protein